MTEYVERVDIDDRVLAVVSRRDAVRHGWLHRIATTICRDEQGRVLVHRRPEDASSFPGCYETSFGGAVRVGETYEQAARREVVEELGVSVPVRHLLTFLCQGQVGAYYLAVHEAHLSPQVANLLRPDPQAVSWCAWMTESALHKARDSWPFVPDGRIAYDRAATPQ